MQNVCKFFLWCAFCAKAASLLPDPFELHGALEVFSRYSSSVGTDRLNKKVCMMAEQILDLICFVTDYMDSTTERCVPASLCAGKPDYIPMSVRLENALWDNQQLLAPPPLVSGLETHTALPAFDVLCRVIISMQHFREHCENNSILKSLLLDCQEEDKAFMLAITQQEAVHYLRRYLQQGKDKREFWSKKMKSGGEDTLRAGDVVDHLYARSAGICVQSLGEATDFASFIYDIRDVWWKIHLSKFWAYAQVDKLCPGLVHFWKTERQYKEAEVAEQALSASQLFMSKEKPLGSEEWLGYRFKRVEKFAPSGVLCWKDVLGVMDQLTQIYTKDNDKNQERVVHFLAVELASCVAKAGFEDSARQRFVGEIMPQSLSILERLGKLNLSERKISFLTCVAPCLMEGQGVLQEIVASLKGRKLSFLCLSYLYAEGDQILLCLHRLEEQGICSGQVARFARYMQKSVQKTSPLQWNQIVLNVIQSLGDGPPLRSTKSFLHKMNGVIKECCSNKDGFWTYVRNAGQLSDDQQRAIHQHIPLPTNEHNPLYPHFKKTEFADRLV